MVVISFWMFDILAVPVLSLLIRIEILFC